VWLIQLDQIFHTNKNLHLVYTLTIGICLKANPNKCWVSPCCNAQFIKSVVGISKCKLYAATTIQFVFISQVVPFNGNDIIYSDFDTALPKKSNWNNRRTSTAETFKHKKNGAIIYFLLRIKLRFLKEKILNARNQ